MFVFLVMAGLFVVVGGALAIGYYGLGPFVMNSRFSCTAPEPKHASQ